MKNKQTRHKPLPVTLDRLAHAISVHLPGAEPSRSDLLAIAAYAFGHRNQNELAAAAKAGALDAPPVVVDETGPIYTYLTDPLAGAAFAVETEWLAQIVADERRETIISSPYGHLVDLAPALIVAPTPSTAPKRPERPRPPGEVDAE